MTPEQLQNIHLQEENSRLKHDLNNEKQKVGLIKEYSMETRARGHRDYIEDVYGPNKQSVEQIGCIKCNLKFSGLPHREVCRLCSIN